MKILIAYYSRTLNNAELALLIAEDLIAKGHTVDFEKIEPVKEENRWLLLKRTWMNWPLLLIGMFSNKYRRYFYDNFKHHEMDIKPLAYPDVSGYDRIIIGSPKWLFMSYPVARYIRQVEGLKGKKVGFFSAWCGPPLKNFEVEAIFKPACHRLERRGAKVVSLLGLSSGFHEYHNYSIFNFFSFLRFGHLIDFFTTHSEYGKRNRKLFVDLLLDGNVDMMESKGWRRSYEGYGLPIFADGTSLSTLRPLRRWYSKRILKTGPE
jgi:flavodoxin